MEPVTMEDALLAPSHLAALAAVAVVTVMVALMLPPVAGNLVPRPLGRWTAHALAGIGYASEAFIACAVGAVGLYFAGFVWDFGARDLTEYAATLLVGGCAMALLWLALSLTRRRRATGSMLAMPGRISDISSRALSYAIGLSTLRGVGVSLSFYGVLGMAGFSADALFPDILDLPLPDVCAMTVAAAIAFVRFGYLTTNAAAHLSQREARWGAAWNPQLLGSTLLRQAGWALAFMGGAFLCGASFSGDAEWLVVVALGRTADFVADLMAARWLLAERADIGKPRP